MSTERHIVVQDYSPEWPLIFQELKSVYTAAFGSMIVDIQHVGSTSVPGLAAKPVIDIDIIIASESSIGEIIRRLEPLGYQHLGELGIAERHAFKRSSPQAPADGSQRVWPAHNLYVCLAGSISLRNHLALRDYLRSHPDMVKEYGDLKKKLAAQYPDDIDSYIKYKTAFITDILEQVGFDKSVLDEIRRANGLKE
jgi:GrpB-like predicted nucleotidyltransferase (UPF0157 family)